MIGQAQTGTGKTAAFGLPIMEYVDPERAEVQALVLTPTRELCIQVTQALRTYGAHTRDRRGGRVRRRPDPHPAGAAARRRARRGGHRGARARPDLAPLAGAARLPLRGARRGRRDARPGLSGGRREDPLADARPAARPRCSRRRCRRRSANSPTATCTTRRSSRSRRRRSRSTPSRSSSCRWRRRAQGGQAGGGAARGGGREPQAIVFVRTKVRCDQLFRTLRDRGMNVRALHGDMSQGSRDGVMLAFKGGRVPILVATDVAARGLDISTVTHVINYDVPTSPDTYVHRIGRTGRVGRSGRAITFVEDRQKRELEAIERHIGTSIAQWEQGAVAAAHPRARAPAPALQAAHLAPRRGGALRQAACSAAAEAAGLRVADIVGAVTSCDRSRRRGRARRARARALLLPVGARGRGRARDRGARPAREVRPRAHACSGWR